MMVVIRDVNNVINVDFSVKNEVIDVFFDANNGSDVDFNATNRAEGKCGITKAANKLQYFNVRIFFYNQVLTLC